MGKKNKQPKISNSPKINIKETPNIVDNKKIVFSYEYLDLNNKKFSLRQITDGRDMIKYMENFFEKLNEYSKEDNFKVKIRSRYGDINHIHPIDWKDNRIRESSFTCLNNTMMEQIKDDCWQMGINHFPFRIHGFFIDNIFYIVWIDPNHQLYYIK